MGQAAVPKDIAFVGNAVKKIGVWRPRFERFPEIRNGPRTGGLGVRESPCATFQQAQVRIAQTAVPVGVRVSRSSLQNRIKVFHSAPESKYTRFEVAILGSALEARPCVHLGGAVEPVVKALDGGICSFR